VVLQRKGNEGQAEALATEERKRKISASFERSVNI